mgnify:CR=1 FL=1
MKNKKYRFYVNLCHGWCDGTIPVYAKDEDTAYNRAIDEVSKRLCSVFPELSIDFDVEQAEVEDE